MQERHDLIVDSLNSIKSALNEGCLPGSGASLFRAACALPTHKDPEIEEGYKVVRASLKAPLN
jgi:chaperonin GroEL (HSP60 family)